MILARQVILVEGPSDELIVQKAFLEARGGLPIEAGVEVISVNSLAFRRFLEIGKALKIPVRVVIDNDGKAESVRERFKDFKDDSHIKLCLSDDNNLKTLENHLISANGLEKLNTVLGAQYASEEGLLEFMLANKTECALKVFESAAPLTFPKYISDAIE
jgi:predicted ATP-dependent endonuclease of OLD family